MNEPEQRKEDRYVETARDRRIANGLLLFFVIVVVGGGSWLANAMFEERQLDDCLAQGGRNSSPATEAPARYAVDVRVRCRRNLSPPCTVFLAQIPLSVGLLE